MILYFITKSEKKFIISLLILHLDPGVVIQGGAIFKYSWINQIENYKIKLNSISKQGTSILNKNLIILG